jgi:hypothetical protein
VAEWSCSGLQSRLRRFDSDPGLQFRSGFPVGCQPGPPRFGGAGDLPIEASQSDESVESPRETGSRAGSIVATLGILLLVLALAGAIGVAYWLNNERVDLQHQMIQQSLQVLELRERLTRTEVALQERTAALATRDAALAEANRPVIPVRVTFRLAFMGQGLVASIRNVTDRPLNVIAELRDAGAEPTRTISLALEANKATEIGYAQGWTITSGQSITVSSSGFRSVTAFAP